MLKIGLFFVILVTVLFVIFKMIFKLASTLKVLGIAIIVSIIVLAVTSYILYINDIDYEMLGSGKKYVIGEVISKDNNQIKVRVIEHNMDSSIKRNQEVLIKVKGETAIRLQSNILFEEKKKYDDIKIGNKVNIICDSIENNSIIAQKIVIKY